MAHNILLATDIDLSQPNIESRAKIALKQYNKLRVNRKVKQLKSSGIEVDKDYKNRILDELSNDSESSETHNQLLADIAVEMKNHFIMRSTIHNLNEINIFSSVIETYDIQRISDLLPYDMLLQQAVQNKQLLKDIISKQSEAVNIFVNDSIGNQYSTEDDLSLLIKILGMYKLTKDFDDMDLFELYDLQTNMDFSNKLAMYYLSSGNINGYDNVVNNLVYATTTVNKLIQTKIVDNKLLAILLLNGNSETDEYKSFITCNSVSCFDSTYTTDFTNNKIYSTRTLGELLIMITNETRANIDKVDREQIYMTYDGVRPSSEEYHKWNGLQVFDIDLKEWSGGDISSLKHALYSYLVEFNWFLWICKSASGKGIHIYTKVAPPHHQNIILTDNEQTAKYWYSVSYCNKLAVIYNLLYTIHRDISNIKFAEHNFIEKELTFVDNSVGRITSGIRLTYDSQPLVNHNFVDLHPGFNLLQTISGYGDKYSIDSIFLRDTKTNVRLIERIEEICKPELRESTEVDLSQYVHLASDINEFMALDRPLINYQSRYNVCNTLAALMGKDGLSIAHTLLQSKACRNVEEINSFYACAISNRKQPSKLGIEILKRHGVIKSVAEELKDEVSFGFKHDIKRAIDRSLKNKQLLNTIELAHDEYISDKLDILTDQTNPIHISSDKINIMLSPPGSGKSEFIKKLAKNGKRIMFVLPYISVIKNKVEGDSEIMDLFECYYGNKDIKDLEYGINAVTTFDKFSKANYEKISKMFDYIMIDESHLLFTSSYRIEATSKTVKKIKDLFYISSNDPFAAKICLLTGTETGESYFFGSVANIIRISKKSLAKTMEFMICDDVLDSVTRVAYKAHLLINEGYKLLIPTNKGEIYSEKIIGMIEYLLGRNVKYGYYKRSNTEQEICRLINEQNTIGDYDIVFCSNYLSVGVDINDGGRFNRNIKFASIYLGPFAGYEIEQFNARIRKTGIRSIYCIQTQKNDGTIVDALIEEPNLVLQLTQEDVDNFVDDKSISVAKQNFIAQYDPVLHNISTPGFAYLNGKIQFNLEEYELISFETKYSECMQHPVKVARELSRYGYDVTVSTEFDGLGESIQKELRKIGIEAAKQEKTRKHSLLVGTFIELVEKNTYTNVHGLEYNDVIGWIGKNPDLIYEDREQEEFIHIKFDIFATPTSVTVRNREALTAMYKSAKYLISKYSVSKTLDIINSFVGDDGILKQKQFQRSLNLLRLVENADANELSESLSGMLTKMYDFVDQFESNPEFKLGYNAYMTTLDTWTNEYIDSLGIRLNTIYAYDKVKDVVLELLNDLATKSHSKKGVSFRYNKLPDQNSSAITNRRSVDVMIQNMFKLAESDIKKPSKVRDKHIMLSPNVNF